MNQSPTAEQAAARPLSTRFIYQVFCVFAALALLSVGISGFGKWAGRSIALAGHTVDRSVFEVVIGNNVLSLPANAIRFERGRRDGVAARAELYLLWPGLDGYTDETRDEFNHAGGRRNIVFLTFDERIMSRDMSGRFGPIYSQVIKRPGRAGPSGLTVYDFAEQSGYVDEVLVVGDRGNRDPFVARCLSGTAARESLAPCERDVHLGDGLNLVYRFPAGLADDWRELDAAVVGAAEGFLKTAR